MLVENMDVDVDEGLVHFQNGVTVKHKPGFDVDLIGGYDFGMIRLEGELSWKRASVDEMKIDPLISGGGAGDNFDADGHGRAETKMA